MSPQLWLNANSFPLAKGQDLGYNTHIFLEYIHIYKLVLFFICKVLVILFFEVMLHWLKFFFCKRKKNQKKWVLYPMYPNIHTYPPIIQQNLPMIMSSMWPTVVSNFLSDRLDLELKIKHCKKQLVWSIIIGNKISYWRVCDSRVLIKKWNKL